uniref:Chromosome 1 open reading frame 51 n=1 Tax=Nothobranchius korthausae TaxID=1143690 RepID=A0A1A8FQJ1_9TELE
MNSLGSSSKWPSYDSLPSTSSFLHSESEQTEDEADVFSDGEVDSGIKRSPSADEGIALSENYLRVPPHRDSRFIRDQLELCPDKTKRPDGASSLTTPTSSSPGDLAFAQKCADLHRFIHPLLELLHGLKSGRFEKGLTSFQQSVAVDRLQRILGILQKPEMGEKYLQNLLQIEMLLKMWFPQKAFECKDTSRPATAPALVPHWRQNQLHIPVKKRKLSWSDLDVDDRVPTKHSHHQQEKHECCHAATSLDTVSTRLPPSPQSHAAQCAGDDCTARPKFTDRTGLFSRLSCSGRNDENQTPPETPLPFLCVSPATQDCSVSSSSSVTPADSP